jgi:hypothetical protein
MSHGTLSFFATQLPASVRENVDNSDRTGGGVWGVPSYFNATLTNDGLLNGKYDAWCASTSFGIWPDRDYSAFVYSSYGSIPSNVLPAGQVDADADGYLDSLQAINWIFNNITEWENVVQSSPGIATNAYQYDIDGNAATLETFTSGDVQLAMWKLLNADITPGDLGSIGSYDDSTDGESASDQIVALALARGRDFVPMAGQDIGVILSPTVDGVSPVAQPTIIEVKTAGIGDTVFFDKNNNGFAEADEGIKDVTVRLWADTNGDGSVDTYVASAVTGDNPNTVAVETGYYFFGPLLAGTTYDSTGNPGPGIVYKVVVDTSTLPNGGVGWANTVDPDGPAVDGDSMSTETLTPGEVNLKQDFGYRALDYGDNPDSYGTTNAANGARHVLSVGQTAATPALYLGAKVDTESDGQPSAGANGDNLNNLNDEDGIQFLTPIQAGQSTQVKVTVVEAAGVDGRLNAWIDFNGDGDFSDAGEQIFTDLAVINGMQTLSFTAPTDAVLGDTYARFRLSTDTGLTSTGLASNGEVEDYQVAVKPLGSIGDKIWLDCNNDGIQDAGEAGVAGVTVHLLKAGQEIETTITDDNGEYLFSNLGVGSYAIQVEKPVGYAFTTQDAGGNTNVSDAKDSDVNAMGLSAPITLGTGDNNLTVDAGLIGDPVCVKYDFSGSSSTSGDFGNSRTYELSGVSVTATAWSRVQDNSDTWAAGYLGAYGGGLGVTDTSESGWGNSHTVDNLGGRDNYVVFQFSQDVIVDKAFLGYVVDDSDISVWIGSSASPTPITTVNDAFLASMTHYEENWTGSSYARWADFNSGDVSGNVLIIAANTSDTTPEDAFKIENLKVCTAVSCNASIGDRVWLDSNGNGLQDTDEAGVAGVTVKLLNSTGGEIGSKITDANGYYLFSNLTPGDYAIQVEKPIGYVFTTKDAGSNTNDAMDSDVDTVTGKTVNTNLMAGETDRSWDAGLVAVTTVCKDLVFSGGTETGSGYGNIRSYSDDGLAVNVSAFSSDKNGGTWQTAYLGSYGGGLGVSDQSEGFGSWGNKHTVDNTGGRDNYVLFEFNQQVVLDKAYLGYVVGDSDLQVWIGNFTNAYSNHLSLNSATLSSMGFTEVNTTTSGSARWADLNENEFVGNTIVIAADTTDTSPEDYFKIQTLSVCTPTTPAMKASIGDKGVAG